MAVGNFWRLAASGAALVLAVPILADTKTGVDAWTRGDFAAAVKVWQVEAVKGDADAMFNLGQAYKLGKGVTQDLARAEDLFGKASALGHLQAGDNYGLLLFQRGQRTQALPFIRAAADRGDPRAQYLLGIGHFNGDIVPNDWVRAYALLSLAQAAGLPQAAQALTQMDKHIPLAQRQEAATLAVELRSQTDATRARQLAAADLGAAAPAPRSAPPSVAMRTPAVTAPTDDGPATAGADYARPVPAPAEPRPVAVRQGVPPAVVARPPVEPRSAPAPVQAAGGSWRVQLGAFGVAGNADALWNRLKSRPELAGKRRIDARAGAMIKLQAGGFASEADARAACSKLSAIGQACIATKG